MANDGSRRSGERPTSQRSRAWVRFTVADETLMAAVAENLGTKGFQVERSAGPIDYYRIVPTGSTEPTWLIARSTPDGGYRLYSGTLATLASGRTLRAILPPDWQN